MIRKQRGKKAQRRKYEEESSAPKRRRICEEGFKSMWNGSGERNEMLMDGDKRKADEDILSDKSDQPEKKIEENPNNNGDIFHI